MKQDIAHNLFSNFQSTIFKAVKTFLHKQRGEDADKPITTSLRITSEIKEFYECLAETEMTSLNTAIVNTLNKVKEQTINEYQTSYSKINDIYDYQINSLIKIIDDQKIDYNDLCILLKWITDHDISRSDLANKQKLINIIDKKSQLKLCETFGYNYDWIQDNKYSIFYKWPRFQDRWYKHVKCFIQDLIINFYLDETVESFEISFLCCDRNIVNNIISHTTPSPEESITPIVIAERCINGLKTKTYHKFESNNINYDKCRRHFVVLIKMITMLRKHGIVKFPNGYVITHQQHDMIQDGSMHLAELFNNNYLSNRLCLDDLDDISSYYNANHGTDSRETNTPNIYHALKRSVIIDILTWSEKDSSSIALTDELASKCYMSKNKLSKYLRLFDIYNPDPVTNGIFSKKSFINLIRIRELQLELQNCKILDTAFG